MNSPLLTDKSFLINYLRSNGIFTKKSYGQNFVIDVKLISTLLNCANVSEDDVVLEIGPGIGSLTERLLDAGATVVCVEIDSRFVSLLKHHFQDNPRFYLVEGDFLKKTVSDKVFDLLAGFKKKPKTVSNLPYYITSPIIAKLLQSCIKFERITLTIQKEVAQRIIAFESVKQYSAITVFVKYYADAFIEAVFAPSSFYPSPKVDSAVISLVPYAEPLYAAADREFFHQFVKLCFTERRKMLKNSICRVVNSMQVNTTAEEIDKILNELGIDGNVRPETLTIERFIRIADRLIAKYAGINGKFGYLKK